MYTVTAEQQRLDFCAEAGGVRLRLSSLPWPHESTRGWAQHGEHRSAVGDWGGNRNRQKEMMKSGWVTDTIQNWGWLWKLHYISSSSLCSWKWNVSSCSSCSSGLKSEVQGERLLPLRDAGKIYSEGNASIAFDPSFETNSWSWGIYFPRLLKLNVFIDSDSLFLEELQLLGQTSPHSAALIPLGAGGDWQGGLWFGQTHAPRCGNWCIHFSQSSFCGTKTRRIFLLSMGTERWRKMFPVCLWWQGKQRQPMKLVPVLKVACLPPSLGYLQQQQRESCVNGGSPELAETSIARGTVGTEQIASPWKSLRSRDGLDVLWGLGCVCVQTPDTLLLCVGWIFWCLPQMLQLTWRLRDLTSLRI